MDLTGPTGSSGLEQGDCRTDPKGKKASDRISNSYLAKVGVRSRRPLGSQFWCWGIEAALVL